MLNFGDITANVKIGFRRQEKVFKYNISSNNLPYFTKGSVHPSISSSKFSSYTIYINTTACLTKCIQLRNDTIANVFWTSTGMFTARIKAITLRYSCSINSFVWTTGNVEHDFTLILY